MRNTTNSLVFYSANLVRFGTRRLPLALLATSLLALQGNLLAQQSSPQPLPTPPVGPAIPLTGFSKIAHEAGPAVVNINVEILPKASARASQGNPQGDDNNPNAGPNSGGDNGDDGQSPGNSPQDFFRRFFGQSPDGGGQPPQAERGLGSGFIVDPHGYILTADHVIDKADRIYVKLTTDPQNSQGHRATVVGVDKDTDLAVIKIDAPYPLPTLKFDNSQDAQPGSWVEAIGSPFDLSQTVTAGIVSAVNRNINGSIGGEFKHFIQTDAAINPGNSGGPLLDINGNVIGVNDAYLTQSSGYLGIGFAIPSNTAILVYNQLIGPQHRVVRGSLGIRFQSQIDPATARMYQAQTGVLISFVTPGKAADKAGLQPNDVIVSIDGQPIKDGDDLIETITPRRPGSSVTVGYLRNGKKQTVTCILGDLSETENLKLASASSPSAPSANPSRTKLGLTITDGPSASTPSGDSSQAQGVLIRAVAPGSFADELNPPATPGTVIVALNRTPVHSVSQFNTLLQSLHSGDAVVLELLNPNSGGQSTLTSGTLP